VHIAPIVVQARKIAASTAPGTDKERGMNIVPIFIYLQLLDILTTLVGFRLGAAEASPFIRLLMHAGPAVGVISSKFFALGLGAVCVRWKRLHVIRWATYWYGGLIVWNLMVMLAAQSRG
jgi:Domain of unknown function (DUF5658)